jgi:hypothetical protein
MAGFESMVRAGRNRGFESPSLRQSPHFTKQLAAFHLFQVAQAAEKRKLSVSAAWEKPLSIISRLSRGQENGRRRPAERIPNKAPTGVNRGGQRENRK